MVIIIFFLTQCSKHEQVSTFFTCSNLSSQRISEGGVLVWDTLQHVLYITLVLGIILYLFQTMVEALEWGWQGRKLCVGGSLPFAVYTLSCFHNFNIFVNQYFMSFVQCYIAIKAPRNTRSKSTLTWSLYTISSGTWSKSAMCHGN